MKAFDPATADLAVRKPLRTRKRLLVPAAALALGFALSSCGTEASSGQAGPAAASAEAGGAQAPAVEAAPELAAPAIGVPFPADMGGGNTARITIVSAEFTDAVSVESFAPAAQNGGFLLLDVLWETEEGITNANPLYFDAKDAEGRKGEMYLFADGQLGSGEVLPGDKSRGYIAFDMAPGAATVTVSNPMLQEAARIQIGG